MTEIPGLPDWPVIRHLTWREAHLFELGIWPGIGIALAIAGDDWGLAIALFSVIRKKMHSDTQTRDSDDLIRGYIRDAWYLAMGAITGIVLGTVLISILRY